MRKRRPDEAQLMFDGLPRDRLKDLDSEYGRVMGRDALARQRRLAEEAATCTCNESKRVAYHAPGCPRAKRRK